MAKSKVKVTHCAQTTEDIDMIFLCMRAARLSQIILKFRLHCSTPFSPNSVPMWLTPVDLSVADIWQQIAAVWWYSGNYAECTIAFSNGIADPHDLPFSQKWGSRALSPFVKLLVLLMFQELLVSCQYYQIRLIVFVLLENLFTDTKLCESFTYYIVTFTRQCCCNDRWFGVCLF